MSKLSELINAISRSFSKPAPAPTPAPAAKAGEVGNFKRVTCEKLEIKGGPIWAAFVCHPHGELAVEIIDSTVTPMVFTAALNFRPGGQTLIRLRHEGQVFEVPIAVLKALADAANPQPEPAPEVKDPSNP